jgi:hypothetical protein
MTLAELRQHLAGAQGRVAVNGLPYVDGAGILCHACRRPIGDQQPVTLTAHDEDGRWTATVSHQEDGPDVRHIRWTGLWHWLGVAAYVAVAAAVVGLLAAALAWVVTGGP